MDLQRLRSLRGFIVDLDGTTYLGQRLTPGAREFFRTLSESGRQYVFVTNNSSKSGDLYENHLRHLGLTPAHGQVLTSGEATAMVLARRGDRRAYIVGTEALETEMTRAGLTIDAEAPDCVVLGYDRTLTYAKLEIATRLIRRGVPFIATHPDLTCPTEDGYVPDCGAMTALLEAATGVPPIVVGKPEPLLAQMALQKLGLPAPDVAVIGDRLYTDMEMGHRAGTTTILVLSGETTMAMVDAAARKPDFVVAHLGALAAAMQGSMPAALTA